MPPTKPLAASAIIHRMGCIPSTQMLAEKRAAEILSQTIAPSAPSSEYLEAWLATEQASGVGQYDRHFISPPGGFYLSLLMMMDAAVRMQLLPIAVAYHCAMSLRQAGAGEILIRWPNDLCHSGKKIGGILCRCLSSGNTNALIIGIGINTNSSPNAFPVALRPHIATLKEGGMRIDHEKILEAIISGIHTLREPAAVERAVTAASAFDALRGHRINVSFDGRNISGISWGWDAAGHLLLDAAGQMKLASGSISAVDGRPIRPA